jgi:hypothetical protein
MRLPLNRLLDKAEVPMRQFMSSSRRDSRILPCLCDWPNWMPGSTAETAPMRVLVPAFVTSELEVGISDRFHDLHPIPGDRHRGGQHADVAGHDDAFAGFGGACLSNSCCLFWLTAGIC